MAPDDLATHWCSIGRVKRKILNLFRKQHFSLTITMCEVIIQYFFTFKCNLTFGGSAFSSNRLWHSCDKNVFRPPRFTNNSDGVLMIFMLCTNIMIITVTYQRAIWVRKMTPIMIIALILWQRTAHISHDNLCYYKCNLIYLGIFSEIIVRTISDFCRISSVYRWGMCCCMSFWKCCSHGTWFTIILLTRWIIQPFNMFGELIWQQDFHGINVHCGNDVIDTQVREGHTAADRERHCHEQETVSMSSWTMLRFLQQLDVVPAKFIISMRLIFLQLEKIIYGYE